MTKLGEHILWANERKRHHSVYQQQIAVQPRGMKGDYGNNEDGNDLAVDRRAL